jgi:hypothetical protein
MLWNLEQQSEYLISAPMDKHTPSRLGEGLEDEGCPPSPRVASLGAAEGDLREPHFKVCKNWDKCMKQGDVGTC